MSDLNSSLRVGSVTLALLNGSSIVKAMLMKYAERE
jgi:hypothetical protein